MDNVSVRHLGSGIAQSMLLGCPGWGPGIGVLGGSWRMSWIVAIRPSRVSPLVAVFRMGLNQNPDPGVYVWLSCTDQQPPQLPIPGCTCGGSVHVNSHSDLNQNPDPGVYVWWPCTHQQPPHLPIPGCTYGGFVPKQPPQLPIPGYTCGSAGVPPRVSRATSKHIGKTT